MLDLGLRGKIALVTGAGGTIGAAIAQSLAHNGVIAYVADANAAAARDIAARLDARPLTLDVGDADAAGDAVARIVHEAGRIDILVNNAGILKTGPFADATTRDWDEVCRVNLSGVYYCCKAAVPAMMSQRYGKIVNIASVSAVKGGGSFGNVLYGTTKAGVVAMTKGLARELAPHGINVNAISPGVLESGMTGPLMTPQRRAAVVAMIPAGRLAETSDVANTVLMLCSDLFAYVNGASIPVDGGYLVR